MKRVTVVVLVLVLVAAAAAAVARALEYRGMAKPGVHVLGLDVGGKSRVQIESALRAWAASPVTIRAGGRSYHVQRGWLAAINAHATASRALASGSAIALVVPQTTDVKPVVVQAGGAGDVLEQIARAGQTAVSATVTVHGPDVSVTPARTGRELNRAALLERLAQGSQVVDAPFAAVRPKVTDAAAQSAAADAKRLLAEPVRIDFHGARLGALAPAQLGHALTIEPAAHGFSVRFDPDTLARNIRPRLGRWIVRAHNAQFTVSGDSVHVVPSKAGSDVDPRQIAAAVTAAARGQHVARVELGPRQPDLTTAEANTLGIRTRLVSFTTQMGPSSSNRIHNVHLMADFIDGTVIRPGDVFSFNEVVGPRTADRGFLEGQEIIGSLVLPSIGGGVCQTATTLFNDAFELGLPILARTNHNLYLSHYPLGRDATVAWGGPDLEFRNDLGKGLLIKSSYTDQTLTFTFYGTPTGRRIVSHTGPKLRWKKPSMNYAVDPSAPHGSVKVVPGSGELGFDVSVTRDVFDRGGKLIRHDVFKSRYIPDSPTTVYGPGKKPPGPYIVLPATA